MGIAGIAVMAILIFVLVFWSIRAVKQSKDYDTQLITAGGLSGMCGVLVHNLSENVFEVPYMVAYFWVIAAIVFYFGFRSRQIKAEPS